MRPGGAQGPFSTSPAEIEAVRSFLRPVGDSGRVIGRWESGGNERSGPGNEPSPPLIVPRPRPLMGCGGADAGDLDPPVDANRA